MGISDDSNEDNSNEAWPFIGFSSSENYEFMHMTKECQSGLMKIEEEEEKNGGKSHERGFNRVCGDDQQTVLLTRRLPGDIVHKLSKCFPLACRCSAIKAELEENAKYARHN